MITPIVCRSEVILTWLKENKFTKVKGRLPNQTEFTEDEHCPDCYVFNTADRGVILESQLVRDHYLIVQVITVLLYPCNPLRKSGKTPLDKTRFYCRHINVEVANRSRNRTRL